MLAGEGGGGSGSVSADDILEALRDFDGDVTHQFEALQVAQRYFEENGAGPALRTALDQAERAFDEPDLARDVRAGYTIAAQAAVAAPTLETSPGALRDAYREMLRSGQNIGQLFDKISDFNIRFSFSQAVDLFMTAAGNDLADTNSQTDPILLGALNRELGALKEMRTVFEEGNRLINMTQRIDPSFGTGPDAAGPIELTSALLNFSAKQSPSLSDARNLVKQFEPAEEATLVVFANGLQDLHRLMSDRSVTSASARVQQVSMIENLRIELSAAEEAAFTASNS
jgi:type III secretion system YopN/LcrE/InvE/MxiC family regulator